MMKNHFRVLLVLAIISLSAVFFILPNIPNSFAHALIAKSDPAPSQSLPTSPSKVDVYFTDPVDIRYSTIKVLDPSGKEIQNKDERYLTNDQKALSVSLPAGLPNGVYTVSTKVLDQTDGHVTKNGFVFAVGVTAPIPTTPQSKISYSDVISIPDTITRFPALMGQVIVVGAALSTLWLWSPLPKLGRLHQRFAETRLKIDKKATMLMLVGSTIVFASGFGMIAAVAYSIHAGFGDAVSTKFGQMWIIRMIAASVLLGLAIALYFKQKRTNAVLSKLQTASILGVGITVLSTTSIISHGAATGQVAPLFFDFIHNLAASVWIGGILYIDFIIISKLKQLGDERVASSILSIIIPKFSTVALFILGTITISGPFLLFLLESNLALTLASIYGKILIVKLSLAAIMIGAGAYHQFVVHKYALANVTASSSQGVIVQSQQSRSSTLSKFGTSIKIESVAGILLIVAVATLVDSGLPATEFQGILQSQQSNSLAFGTGQNSMQSVFSETRFVENGSRVVLSVDPFFIGSNDITISFFDSKRNPIDIQSVLLEVSQTEKQIAPIKVDTQQIAKGVYSARTDSLTIPGNWYVHVEGVPTAAGSLSLVADYDLALRPRPSQILATIQENKLPDKESLPLYPTYDTKRNVVWVGDTKPNSSRIWEFDLNSKQYTEHKINGINYISVTAQDSNNNLWYVDPRTKILGYYQPDTNKDQKYSIPANGIISGLALDSADNPWLIDVVNNMVLKFDAKTKTFHSINLLSGSLPLGISIDKSTNQVWITESNSGKIANIDPAQNYKITEHAPPNGTLVNATGILFDSATGKVFVSEHEGHSVSVFDPLIKTFQRYKTDQDSNALPFGMAFDANHDLWIAQHQVDKIEVLDPRTGETNEFDIPSNSSFVQWLTTDSQGNIIMAEQRAHSIGIVTTTTNPSLSPQTSQAVTSSIPQLDFSYADVAAPAIVAGLVAVAFIYSRSTLELKKSLNHIRTNFN
jgi:copper transport protein